MKTPKYLSENGTIGLVAPSFGCATSPYKECLDNAIRQFEKRGYKIITGPNCYAGSGIGISNTPKLCAEEFVQMYENKDTEVLLSCGGGELMCEILEYVDFEKIKNLPPKWFTGYSDNTNLTYLLTTLCDIKSLYSVCAPSFGMKNWYENHFDTMSVLHGKKKTVEGYPLFELQSLKSEDNPLAEYNLTETKRLVCYNSEGQRTEENMKLKGRLLGGCMDCLVTLLGTRFDKTEQFLETYKEEGILWFLEACDLNVFGIRRAMWQMEQAGWFRYVKGFIIGRPLSFGQNMMGLDQYEAVLPIIRKHNVPVIFDADFGHLSPSVPVICGAMATVSTRNGNISFSYYDE